MRLEGRDRVLVRLYLDGWSYAEIAAHEEVGLDKADSARKAVARAIERLKRLLG